MAVRYIGHRLSAVRSCTNALDEGIICLQELRYVCIARHREPDDALKIPVGDMTVPLCWVDVGLLARRMIQCWSSCPTTTRSAVSVLVQARRSR